LGWCSLAKRQILVAEKFTLLPAFPGEGSALLPSTSFRLSGQQVDDEPIALL